MPVCKGEKLALAGAPEGGSARAPAWNRNRSHHACGAVTERAGVVHVHRFLTEMNKGPEQVGTIPVEAFLIPCYLFP
jgi:hypothetical protein